MRTESPVFPCTVRSDGRGDGSFGASRGILPGGRGKFHDGVDLVVSPGQLITSPINGTVEKIEYPYASDLRWTGIQLRNHLIRCEIWYMTPKDGLVGTYVSIGWPLGYAQDISEKYPQNEDGKMTPHIHVRMSLLPFSFLVDGAYKDKSVFLDPMIFFELSQKV